jgi:hypothetical protein
VRHAGRFTFAESAETLDYETPLVSLLSAAVSHGNTANAFEIIPVLGSIESYTTRKVGDFWPSPLEFVLRLDGESTQVQLIVHALIETRKGLDANTSIGELRAGIYDESVTDHLLAIPPLDRNPVQQLLLANELGRRRLMLYGCLCLHPGQHGKILPAVDAVFAKSAALLLEL